MVDSIGQKSVTKSSNQTNLKIAPIVTNQNPPNPALASNSKTNIFQSNKSKSQQPGSKKMGKGNKNQENPSQENQNNQSLDEKKKPHYACLICNDEHFMKDCSRHVEINRLFKVSSTTLVILTDPFANQKTNMVAQNPSSSSQVMILTAISNNNGVFVATRDKDHGHLNPSTGKVDDKPSNST